MDLFTEALQFLQDKDITKRMFSLGDVAHLMAGFAKSKLEEKSTSTPPVEGAQQKYAMQGWICPRCGKVHGPFTTVCSCPPETKTAATITPTAEGAEEILTEEQFTAIIKAICEDVWYSRRSLDPVKEQTELIVKKVYSILALHAQRIAEKMVSERLEQNKAQFKDRPNPQNVNPYDSKGRKRLRSRLTTPQVTPQVPYKTEGGGE